MAEHYKGSGKLQGQVAIVTGGDSGIGRAVAVLFAREGADVAIAYLSEDRDAEETKRAVEKEGRRCIAVAGDMARSSSKGRRPSLPACSVSSSTSYQPSGGRPAAFSAPSTEPSAWFWAFIRRAHARIVASAGLSLMAAV